MGKGSKRRPSFVSESEVAIRLDFAFGNVVSETPDCKHLDKCQKEMNAHCLDYTMPCYDQIV